jgi:hypothetical protein
MWLVILLASAPYPWLEGEPKHTIESRIAPPAGYTRVAAPEGSFAAWLRALPVKKGKPKVLLYNGSAKGNQDAHHLVVDIDVGERDLQQCADALMRLRAEYLRSRERHEDVCFRFTSGAKNPWSRWAKGERPRVNKKKVTWKQRKKPDDSYEVFRQYLEDVFMWSGSASLSLELATVTDARDVRAGDVYIQGGFPGHAILVVDAAENEAGERVFLLLQSYTPAQDMHVLTHPDSPISPWYPANTEEDLDTPEWSFERTDLRRFREHGCP